MDVRRIRSLTAFSILWFCPAIPTAQGQPSRIEFEEFRIEISPGGSKPGDDGQARGGWLVTVKSCPMADYIDSKAWISPALTIEHLRSLRGREELDRTKLQEIGDLVRKSIVKGELDDVLVTSIKLAMKRGKGLRLIVGLEGGRVQGDVINPAELPLELIRFPEVPALNDFPATGRNFTVSRSLGQSPPASQPTRLPIRLLIVAASPKDQVGAKVEDSIAAIREGLKGVAFDDNFQPLSRSAVEVAVCRDATRDTLEKMLDGGRWDIVHFVGHGAFDVVDGGPPQAQILLERPDTHESDRLAAPKFAAMLANRGVRMVVLTACSTAVAQPVDAANPNQHGVPFDGVAHHLIRMDGMSVVVAMQFDLEIEVAKAFAGVFYKSLLTDREEVDVAVSKCRQALFTGFGIGSRAWITPALYSRNIAGRLIDLQSPIVVDGPVEVGSRVYLKPKAKVTLDGQTVVSEEEYLSRMFIVTKIDGQRGLYVTSWGLTRNVAQIDPQDGIVGWVQPENVIPRLSLIEYYTRRLEGKPDYADLLLHRGMAYLEMKEFDTARRDFDTLLARDANNVRALVNRAASWAGSWRENEVIKDCSKAISIDPRFEWAYIIRAGGYSGVNNRDAALNDLDRALDIDPKNTHALTARSAILSKLSRHEEAKVIANEAVTNDPTSPLAHHTLGWVYLGINDTVNASRKFQTAIGLDPLAPPAHIGLAMALGRDKEYDKSISECDEAIRLCPTFAPAYAVRGVGWANKGIASSAMQDCDHAIRLLSHPAWAYMMRGFANQALGLRDGAIKDFSEAIDRDRTLAPAYAGLGSEYAKMGRHDRALGFFQEAIKFDTETSSNYANIGAAYENLNDLDPAIRYFTEALKRSAQTAWVYLRRGACYSKKGLHDLALTDLDKAIQIDPSLPEAWFLKGRTHGLKGDHIQAEICFNRAIGLNPSVADPYDGRAFARHMQGNEAGANADRAEAARIRSQQK